MPFADVNGQHLYFEDSGGDRPPIILSHGFLMDHEMFAPQVAALAPESRVITWDERGFGQTPAAAPFSYWDSADDALALLTHLGIEQAVVGGMSQGGFISLRMALTAPDRVKALVLMDTQSGVEDPAASGGYDVLHDTWMEHGPAPVQDVVAGIILGEGDWSSWFAKWQALDRRQFSYAYRCLMDRDDVTSRLGEITAPAIVFHGTDDAAITMDKAEELRDGLRGDASLVTVQGGSHAANLTHPDQVNGPLLEFMRKYA
jgi:3-oxoadipate enol-lactonase